MVLCHDNNYYQLLSCQTKLVKYDNLRINIVHVKK